MKTKIILVVLVIAATLTECIVMRKSREYDYDAADNIAGLERCVKAMVVLGAVGTAAAVAFVAM